MQYTSQRTLFSPHSMLILGVLRSQVVLGMLSGPLRYQGEEDQG